MKNKITAWLSILTAGRGIRHIKVNYGRNSAISNLMKLEWIARFQAYQS